MITRPLRASELAAYDQAHAGRVDALDALTAVHLDMVDSEGRELATVGLAYYLKHEIDDTSCAELLAIAIDRLAHTEEN